MFRCPAARSCNQHPLCQSPFPQSRMPYNLATQTSSERSHLETSYGTSIFCLWPVFCYQATIRCHFAFFGSSLDVHVSSAQSQNNVHQHMNLSFLSAKFVGKVLLKGLVTPKHTKKGLSSGKPGATSASAAQQAERILILDNSEQKQRLNTDGWKVTEATPCVTNQRTNGRTVLSRRTTLAKAAPRVCESKIPSEVS